MSMPQSLSDSAVLPENPSPLGLELSFPSSSLLSIRNGYESQNQDEKWSIYCREPWVQVWRPNLRGVYCYAVRFEEADSQRIRVAESWLGEKLRDAESWFGPDLDVHRRIVTSVLEGVGGESCESREEREGFGRKFEFEVCSARRGSNAIFFSGHATCLSDVDEIARKLREDVTRMQKEG
jgi:hypothetical protein